MTSPVSWWNRYWFQTSTRYHYGLFRILFVSGFFLLPVALSALGLETGQVSRIARLDALSRAPEDLAQPALLLRLIPLPVAPPSWLGAVVVILAVLAAVGIATRASLIALAAAYLYAGSILNSYGFVAHDTTLPMIVLLVLAFSPRVTTCSLGAYLRRRSACGSWTGFGRKVPVWPARLILVVLALIYFSSGYAKLRETGLDWGDGKTLQSYATDPQPAPYFLQDPDADRESFRDFVGLESFLYSSGTPTSLVRTLAGNDLMMAVIATSSLLWELTFPLVIFVRRLLPWYLAVGLAFHVMVALTFKLYSFYSYPLCYLVFVDWSRLASYVRSGWRGRGQTIAHRRDQLDPDVVSGHG
jgi:hypothetical protein